MGVSAASQRAPRSEIADSSRSRAKARRCELVAQWRTFYRSEPPPQIPGCWLRMAAAFRLQERAQGGLKPALQRQLLRHAGLTAGLPPSVGARTKPGTVLVREWQGVNHTVTVLDKGVAYDGKLYRSLTAVADAITGAHWSGPEFFGLNAKRSVVRNDKTGR